MNRPDSGVLLLVALLAALGMVSAVNPSLDPAVRFGLAVLLVCLLPGYASTAVLFHGRSVDVPERAVLSVGLSLGSAVLGGLLLNLTPRGLTAVNWAALLGGSTILMCTVVLSARLLEAWRRPRAPEAVRRPGPASRRPGAAQVMPILLLVGSFAIVVGAVALAQAGVRDQPRDPFTELWLLPGAGQGQAVVGIRNAERTDLRGRLELTVDGAVVAEFAEIDLGPGETWERTVRVAGPVSPNPIIASLYREETPDAVFRLVRLWPS